MSERATAKVLLSSAARTADTVAAAAMQAGPYRGIRLYLNVTVASGTGGLKVFIQAIDPVSGVKASINAGGSAVIATGLKIYELYNSPAAAAGSIAEAISRQIPASFDVLVTHADGSSYTYTLACELLP